MGKETKLALKRKGVIIRGKITFINLNLKIMKYYPVLLALCQDLEINPFEGVNFNETKGRLTLGKPLIIKNILFGEDAIEIESISRVVNNLFAQVKNSCESASTESGHFANWRICVVKQIAETYQEVILFLMNKQLCPDWGFVLDKGLLFKTADEDTFENNFKEANRSIRESHRALRESILLSEAKASSRL